MPLSTTDMVQSSSLRSMTVALEPAHNVQHSLVMLTLAEEISGFDEWIYRTVASMTTEERATNQLVMIGLYYATCPVTSYPSFPIFVEHLASESPMRVRNRVLDAYIDIIQKAEDGGQPPTYDEILADVNSFLAFLRRGFGDGHFNPDVERRAYTYLIDPPAMHELIVNHMRSMWYKYMAVEWERVRPLLQKAVRAFETIDLSSMGRQAAVEFVIGRPLKADKWCAKLENFEQLHFVPSAHIGPYTKLFTSGSQAWMVFGARLPEGASEDVPELSRAEILVRLNALADDTRLSMLKLLAVEGELRSQDIIQRLDLSQSGASRHLQQLAAAGFLDERRCNGAKCYSLNSARLDATLQALSSFLTPVDKGSERVSVHRMAQLGERFRHEQL